MADRLDGWEATCLAHLRAYRRARARHDGAMMERHLVGLLATLAKSDVAPMEAGHLRPVVVGHR